MERVMGRLGWLLAVVLGLFVVAAMAGIIHGGPLDPPGPPASTDSVKLPGTPIASIPYTISTPGAYYLTHNLALASSGNGITVATDDVTIDLMGFTITGPGPAFTGRGITDGFGFSKNLRVRNGSLASWPDGGIVLGGTTAAHFEDLTIRKSGNGSTGDGLVAAGAGATARNIDVYDTTQTAIWMGQNGRIDGCSVATAGTGVGASYAALIANCTIAHTTSYGMLLGAASVVTDCTITDSTTAISTFWSVIRGCNVDGTTNGIDLDVGSQAINCSVHGSAGVAVRAAAGSVVRGCNFSNNATGIAATGALIEDNSIELTTACAITFTGDGSRANGNKIRGAATGICAPAGTNHNTAFQNTLDGVGAFFTGSLPWSPPMLFPPDWSQPWANQGY